MKFIVWHVFFPRHGSHPARGAWIEMWLNKRRAQSDMSHPARGAWIEIFVVCPYCGKRVVAPRKGCVD